MLLVSLGLIADTTASRGDESMVGRAPIVQTLDRLETSTGESLAELYSTRLEGEAPEFAWGPDRLPCPSSSYYRLSTFEAQIDDSQSTAAEAAVSLLSAKLPPGMRCGESLPRGVSKIRIIVASRKASLETASPPVFYRGDGVELTSSVPCVTLARLCAGRYLLIASVEALDRPLLWFVYKFTVIDVPDGREGRAVATFDEPSERRQCRVQ